MVRGAAADPAARPPAGALRRSSFFATAAAAASQGDEGEAKAFNGTAARQGSAATHWSPAATVTHR